MSTGGHGEVYRSLEALKLHGGTPAVVGNRQVVKVGVTQHQALAGVFKDRRILVKEVVNSSLSLVAGIESEGPLAFMEAGCLTANAHGEAATRDDARRAMVTGTLMEEKSSCSFLLRTSETSLVGVGDKRKMKSEMLVAS